MEENGSAFWYPRSGYFFHGFPDSAVIRSRVHLFYFYADARKKDARTLEKPELYVIFKELLSTPCNISWRRL